jgi:pimeloyl-ACP methyl ester carboxylesterase
MRVTVGGVSLNFEQEGTGTDLVLIHGLGGDLHAWDADVPLFARHHRVLRPDVRGFGLSDKPPGPYSPALFARDLDGLLTACGIGAAHVLGISMGGVIAQRFALEFPARVHSLILVSTSSEVGAQSVAAWQRLADLIEQEGFDARTADASRAFSPTFAARHPEVVAAMGQRNAANDPRGYAAAARAVSDYKWTAELPGLTVPTLILQGLDDQLTPPGGSVKMSRALPNARLLMIPDAGHNLPVEQPLVFHSSVLAFTAGVDFARSQGR